MGLFDNNSREPEKIERDIEVLDESLAAKKNGKGDPELNAGDLVEEKLQKKAELDKAKKDRDNIADSVFEAFF